MKVFDILYTKNYYIIYKIYGKYFTYSIHNN